MNSSAGVEFRIVSSGGNPFDIIDTDDLKAGTRADGETRSVAASIGTKLLCILGIGRVGVALESVSDFRQRMRPRVQLELDAEVEIAPEIEDGGGFEAGLEHLGVLGSGNDETADCERRSGSHNKGPGERAKLQLEPRKRALEQRAANRAKAKGCEENAKPHD